MTVGPRLVLFGYSDVGHAALELLLARGAQVAAVYTHADAPGEALWFPSVAERAAAAGIPVHGDVDFTRAESLAALRHESPDLILSAYYRAMLPAAVLALPRLGAFNIHGSLLPRYRGRAPVNWAVLHGETSTGATLHVMTARADAGDIVDQQPVPIGPDDTAAEVQTRVRAAAIDILDRQLDALLRGTAPRRAQDERQATRFGRRRPGDGAFDWTRPAREIHDLVRAVTHPYPGAFVARDGRRLFVWRTRRLDAAAAPDESPPPSTMRLDRAGRLLVACGDGAWLELVRAQLEGEPELEGAALARRLLPQPEPSSPASDP